MIRVLILKTWDFPPIFRQTPQGKGIWENIHFTTDINSKYDYVLSLDSSPKPIKLYCFKENIWKVNQEPSNEFFKLAHKANKLYSRVFTTDPGLQNGRFAINQPAVPWFIDKSYDQLKKNTIPEKVFNLSCITSLKNSFLGHQKRLGFIRKIKKTLSLDLISTYDYYFRQNPNISYQKFRKDQLKLGYDETVKNKLDGLAPYRFSLIIENFSGPDYWSEKLTDCYLSWTIPIYYGCTNIEKYFPENSLIRIDIQNPDSIGKTKKLLNKEYWIKNKAHLKKARDLILEKHQFFPCFANEIKKWEIKFKNIRRAKEYINMPAENTPILRLNQGINARWEKLKNKLFPNN